MADVATPAPVAAAPKVKKARKSGAGKVKKVSDHPKYAQMIKDALVALKERGGSSRVAILRYIIKQYKLAGEEKIISSHLKLALRAGVKNGSLKQSKGTGAAGSFRLGEKKVAEKKPKAKKATGAVKAKKPAGAKKPKAARKPKVAGSPKKAAKAKSVKPKAIKSKAAKPKSPKKVKAAKPTKAKSPKKAAKPKATSKAKKVVKK